MRSALAFGALGLVSIPFASPRAMAQVTAQVVAAEPAAPIEPPLPEGAPRIEVQIVLQVVVDAKGSVESAVVASRAPPDAPASFDAAAVDAVKAAIFVPSTRDGRPVRSRIEYVVVFRPAPGSGASPPPPAAPQPPAKAITTNQQDEDYAQVVQVRGAGWSSPRGLGDFRVSRELLDASPRTQTSELLSAAPGFFVDHEDGEGFANDVHLRGFDVEHGSGIEMRVGSIPINIPTHIQGQGYADPSFIIPEIVRSVRVLQGPYDPRQGDAAIVGSAYFDLGVAERGYQVKSTYGSFGQWRVLGVAAPRGADDESFAAFSLRQTDGFGQNRASSSGSVMAQYGFDLGERDHVRLLATGYGARAALAGVVRQDDVDAGRIGYFGSYPTFGQNQSVTSSRVIFGADFDHAAPRGKHFEFAPWIMWTDFRARQNFTGNLESSQTDPALSGLGDLFETTNRETAGGLTARFHSAPARVGNVAEVIGEPGVYLRGGHTDQAKTLLDPTTLSSWDRRTDAGLDTLDAGAYVDLDVRAFKRLRVSGGPRADLLLVSVDDRLASSRRAALGVAVGPRLTAEYQVTDALTPVVSYGEGFRSLDAASLRDGDSQPYSRVRSIEVGLRSQIDRDRYLTTMSIFETHVGDELVFEAESGGLESQGASTRSGFVGSFLAKPVEWLLASAALSITRAIFDDPTAEGMRYVPGVPPLILRVDVAARGPIAGWGGAPLTGRVGVGYTFLSARPLTDAIVGAPRSVLNAGASARWRSVEVGLDAHNVLGLTYPDDEMVYVSNWSVAPGPRPASLARHIVAAPPTTLLGTVSLYF